MIGEVISIGDELTSGQRLDTNSQWLSERLGELGVRVMYHTTVADDLNANVGVFRQAAERADLVVATGGLGPTADDLTREAMAAAAGVPLELHQDQLDAIEQLFRRRGRSMPERNRVQAMFPQGSRPIPNPHGTAPGVDQTFARAGRTACRMFALPGVPAEMHEMWQATVAPAIAAMLPEVQVIRHRRIKCFGTGESHLEAMLPDLIRRGREPSVGITVHQATITLRVTARGASAEACDAAMQPTIDEIRSLLGFLAFGEEEDELEDVVARQLVRKKLTLAAIEWGTAGAITQAMGRALPDGGPFLGGLVVRSGDAMAASLGVSVPNPPDENDRQAIVAHWLAVKGRERFKSDLAIAVSPYPQSAVDPSTDPNKIPRCHIALATPIGVLEKNISFAAHPDIITPRIAKEALNLVRIHLLG